jgi:hypothetical protein
MMTNSQQIARDTRVARVTAYMRRQKLVLADLLEIGGGDLKSSDPKLREKARATSRTWSLMAALHVTHADLTP